MNWNEAETLDLSRIFRPDDLLVRLLRGRITLNTQVACSSTTDEGIIQSTAAELLLYYARIFQYASSSLYTCYCFIDIILGLLHVSEGWFAR